MKKLIALLILLFQVLWTFGSDACDAGRGACSNRPAPTVSEVRGFSGLIKAVQSDFTDAMVGIIELSCLLPQLSRTGSDKKKQPVKDDNQQNPLCCGQSIVEGGRWKVEGGRWKVEGGRWKVEGGRWKVEGGRWKVEGGRCEEASDILRFTIYDLRFTILHILKFCVYAPRGGVTGIVSRLAGLQMGSDWVGNMSL